MILKIKIRQLSSQGFVKKNRRLDAIPTMAYKSKLPVPGSR